MIQMLKTRSEGGIEISTPVIGKWTPTSQGTKEGMPPHVVDSQGSDPDSRELRKRRITCASWYYMCRCLGENVDNLLLHCQVTTRLWSVVLKWFGILWLMSGTVKEVLPSWALRRRKWKQGVWNVVPLATMWVLLERKETWEHLKECNWFC